MDIRLHMSALQQVGDLGFSAVLSSKNGLTGSPAEVRQTPLLLRSSSVMPHFCSRSASIFDGGLHIIYLPCCAHPTLPMLYHAFPLSWAATILLVNLGSLLILRFRSR